MHGNYSIMSPSTSFKVASISAKITSCMSLSPASSEKTSIILGHNSIKMKKKMFFFFFCNENLRTTEQ